MEGAWKASSMKRGSGDSGDSGDSGISAHPAHPTHPETLKHTMSTICSKLCSKLCSDNGREMTTEVTKLIRLNRLNSFNYVISRRRARQASFHATISLPVKDWGDDQLHHLLKAYRPYHPYPYRGGGRGGGTKPTCRIPLFFAWKPWDSDPTPRMEL